MGDENDGPAILLPQGDEVVVELEAREFVEGGEGLVHQQKARLCDDGPRDGDTHTHAAGQRARIGAREPCESNTGESFTDTLIDSGFACQPQGQGNVVCRRGPGHERGILKDETGVVRRCVGALSLTTGGRRKTGDKAQQG